MKNPAASLQSLLRPLAVALLLAAALTAQAKQPPVASQAAAPQAGKDKHEEPEKNQEAAPDKTPESGQDDDQDPPEIKRPKITVTLTAPLPDAVVTAPADIPLAVEAQSTQKKHPVTSVDYYQGNTWIGTSTVAPFSFTWRTVPAGTYTLTAVASNEKPEKDDDKDKGEKDDQHDDPHGKLNPEHQARSAPVTIIVNAPPTVSLTAAAVGDLIAPTTITLRAQASDADGTVTKVDFYQGQTLLGTVSQAPYAFTWNAVAAGSYSFTAKATDNLGGATVSVPATLTVVPNQPPQVNLTTPQAGQSFAAPASIALAATASDVDGTVAKVEFFQGSTLLGSATQVPYAYSWANVAAGSYTLTAKATDNKGATSLSSSLSVVVNAAQVKGIFYIYPDQLGTPRVVTDASNKVIWKNDPLGDPFGASTPDEDPDGDGVKFTLNLRFPGQYYDSETGLNYNINRDYDPSIGRYIEFDPIGLAGGINGYAYVGGNPLNLVDPLGLAGGPAMKGTYYPRGNLPNPATPSKNDPGSLDGFPDGVRGLLCAAGNKDACLPKDLLTCTRMRCTPKCGEPYYVDIPSKQDEMRDPSTPCECIQTGINPKFDGRLPGL